MKKIVMLSLLIACMIVSGCSQTSSSVGSANEGSEYPKEPIQLIVPTPAGGSNDTVARALANAVTKYLPNKANVVVVNKPGGGNTMGIAEVSQAEPDGYTLGFAPSFTLTIQPHYGNTPYTYDSFQTIIRVLDLPGFIYVKADAPWQTFEEWLAYVKQHPDEVTIGAGSGSQHIIDRINEEAGVKLKKVSFDGSAPTMTALLGGHVQAAIGSNVDAKGPIESGEIRPLISYSGRKTGDVPLLKEKGINIEVNQLMGLVAPKGLPEEQLTILHDAFKQALEDPEVTEQLEKLGLDTYYGNPEQFQEDLNKNFELDGEMLRKTGQIQ
ncbi:tripartite tricarboxylate transporter substrate binding protein [Bacillus thermotolerans]|uniref:tripartite tricarboxylate transporter substrate binding protein n=1 Tax=Bacillus thermotolerans TaxID=1221996 RepID=UPI00058014FD|nr:tripartite tricarboxylate transporter substrate binding protein [Bacillus thermotolerans]